MIVVKEKEKCPGCYACYSICPKQCITMEEDAEGFVYPKVHREFCIDCGLCEKNCPVYRKQESAEMPIAYAAINKNLEQRLASSSGGIFVLLAENIVRENGVVFGARFDEKFQVVHDYTETLQGIKAFQGSKYVQSRIGNTYVKVKEFLISGRKVLFTGTPCQIEGLKAYLQRDYENLLCVDIICHGVPSPKVWKKYIDFREAQEGKAVQQIFFRHKKYGWKKYTVLFEFSNEILYLQEHSKDLFMRTFLENVCLRPSCTNCQFKRKNRNSDITLADFWGVVNVLPEMDDDKGTSLVIIHSRKGQAFFEAISRDILCKEVAFEEAIQYNSAMVESAKEGRNRRVVFEKLDDLTFDVLANKYAKSKFSIKRIIKRFLEKIGILTVIRKIMQG